MGKLNESRNISAEGRQQHQASGQETCLTLQSTLDKDSDAGPRLSRFELMQPLPTDVIQASYFTIQCLNSPVIQESQLYLLHRALRALDEQIRGKSIQQGLAHCKHTIMLYISGSNHSIYTQNNCAQTDLGIRSIFKYICVLLGIIRDI